MWQMRQAIASLAPNYYYWGDGFRADAIDGSVASQLITSLFSQYVAIPA